MNIIANSDFAGLTMMGQEQHQDKEVTVNQYLFRSYKKPSHPSPPSPPREEEQHSWNLAGGFPSVESVDHVFADDSYTEESSYERQRGYRDQNGYQLDVVKEESSKASTEAQVSQSSGGQPQRASSRIQPDKHRTGTPMPQQLDSKTNGTSSSGVSDLTYPFALYNNLAVARDERNYSPSRLPNSGPPPVRRAKHPGSPDMEAASSPSFGRKVSRPIPLMKPAKDDTSLFGSITSSKLRKMNKRGTHKSHAIAHASNNPATMLKNFFVALEQRRLMHKLTAQHMRVVDTWFLFAPSITLSLMTGIVIFIFETTLKIDTDGRIYAAIIAGITALVSVFWQALSRQLDLGTQGALHETAAGTFQKLSADILLTVSSTASDEKISAHYVAIVAEKYDQAMGMSPATIPYVLESAFAAVSHRLDLMLNPPVGKKSKRKKRLQNLELIRLYANAYDELAAEILHHWAWPLAFPQPRRASERAIRNFTLVITEGRRSKRGFLSSLCPFWKGEKKPKKSLFDVFPTSSSVSAPGDQDSVSVYHTPQRKPLIQKQSPYQDEV